MSRPSPVASIDEAPLGPFQRRLLAFSCGGPFCDGYILGIIAVALGPLSSDIGLSPNSQGLIAAASLGGMIVGGLLFGYVTDLVGRKVMYTLDLLFFVIASAAQFWVQDPVALFALRFLLGIAIGADYPIVCALMAEFAPKRQRGMLLAGMVGAWWLGYTSSFIVGYVLSFHGHAAWRWILASSAIPAAIVALMRFGTPESPRWLVAKNRADEAREVVRRYFGTTLRVDEAPPRQTMYGRIFRGTYLGRTAFVCVFWSCQIIPTFGIYTFAPALLRALGSPNPILGTATVSVFFLVGIVPSVLLVDRVGRRPLLTIPFAVTGVALLLLALMPDSVIVVGGAFIVFALFNAGSSVLQWVYPSELFPTEVRATAVGFCTGVSRVGAALGTFLTPIALQKYGVSQVMLIFAGVCAIGWVTSLSYAPETRGLSLSQAGDDARAETRIAVPDPHGK